MTAALRVLIVEDVEAFAALLRDELLRLGRPVHFERVDDAAAMRAALGREPWHVVLCNWSLPRLSGLGALQIAGEFAPDLPFIVVSESGGEEVAVEAMRAGARDYVLRQRLDRLVPAVERELREGAERAARREAEAMLRQQDQRFRALIERSEDGIALAARDGSLLYLSPTARRILGLASEAAPVASLAGTVHPDDRAHFDETLAELAGRPGETAAVACRVLRPDGSQRWIEGTRTNLLDDPAVGAIITNFRDVSERQHSRADLRASEARFFRLSESGIIGIAFSDVLGTIHDANDAFLGLLGYGRADMAIGLPGWVAMTSPEWRHASVAASEQLKATGIAGPWETELIRKDGGRASVLLGVAMLDHPHCIGFIIDLSDRKRAEEALRKTEEQLRHSQKMEAVGRLAGGVAHDFNNLLSVVLGYNDLALADLGPDDPLRENLVEIGKAGERAAELTRQLLAFSRQQVLQPRVVSLDAVLRGMERMLARVVGEDVALVVVPSPDSGCCWVDPGQIEQVVMNLVVNARDAMPAGGRLTLETSSVDLDPDYVDRHVGARPGPHVMLAVTDTGTGIDEAARARIFEPFFTTKEVGRGTGLGLSTVHGIVQQSGGSIWVYSEPGLGTTFKIYLPRVEGALDVDRAPAVRPVVGGTETVLLVEDEEQVRKVTRDILHRVGYRVLEACNAREALLICEAHGGAIHLLLTDVVMPGTSGSELARQVVALRPATKVLFMSGYTDDSIVRHGVLAPGVAFLQKPLTPDSIARRVREVLDAGTTGAP